MEIKVKDVWVDDLEDYGEEGAVRAEVSINGSEYVEFFEYVTDQKLERSCDSYFYMFSESDFRVLIQRILEESWEENVDELFFEVCDIIDKELKQRGK